MWGLRDMPKINPKIKYHKLSVNPEEKLIRPKKRHLSKEMREFVCKETQAMLVEGHI